MWCGDLHYLGRLLITGSADNTLRLWDVKTGQFGKNKRGGGEECRWQVGKWWAGAGERS